MREGNLITKCVILPLPNSPEIDSSSLYRYAENWVEDTYGIGDYFCRTSEADPDFYKLINYKIEIMDTYNKGELFLKQIMVVLTFKHIYEMAFIDIKNLESKQNGK